MFEHNIQAKCNMIFTRMIRKKSNFTNSKLLNVCKNGFGVNQ